MNTLIGLNELEILKTIEKQLTLNQTNNAYSYISNLVLTQTNIGKTLSDLFKTRFDISIREFHNNVKKMIKL